MQFSLIYEHSDKIGILILIRFICSSAQQAQNNAAAAAVHAAIHLKEIPEESVRHDEFATNHNYDGRNGPSPSQATVTAEGGSGGGGSSAQRGEYEFAGYKK